MSTMPFGKYKGWKLWNLPDSYLEWLIDQDFCREPLRSNIREEWDSRQAGNRRDYHGEYHSNASSQSRNTSLPPKERAMVIAVIDAGYRAVSKKVHPDLGGTHDDMVALNRAIEQLRLWIG